MSSEPPSSNPSVPKVDPYKLLEITPNPDGSITRSPRWTAATPATAPDSNPASPILSKDIPINPSKNTSLRLFLPYGALKDSAGTSKKLPLVIYFHGGGFILGSVQIPFFHEYCSEVSTEIPAIVASVGYRLAPEHRLPAAYDDAVEAIDFLRTAREDWLMKYADLSSCFLMGSSAGANIAYHVGLRLADPSDDLSPLKIRGLVLCQPFFGGADETESEKRVVNDPILPHGVSDLMWELALPTGAGRDHEYCNPTMNGGLGVLLGKIRAAGWKCLVTGCCGDPLVDRQMVVSDLIERKGIPLERCFLEGGFHGADVLDPAVKRDILCMVRKFISSAT